MQNQTPPLADITMIFSSAAYLPAPSSLLSRYPQTANWSIVWASDPTLPNFAIVGVDATNTQYIVAIRGSEIDFVNDPTQSFINWFEEDLKIFSQAEWPWFVPAAQSEIYNAVIAQGSMNTLNKLQTLADVNTGVLLPDYLIANASNNNNNIIITGHSLGGDAASVFAPYMQWYINNNANSMLNGKDTLYTNMYTYTYAAPAAGNLDFATYYNTLYTSDNQWYRICNTNDIVPNFPVGLHETISKMFTSGPDATQINITILGKETTLSGFFTDTQGVIDGNMLLHHHSLYTQTNYAEGVYSFTNPIDPTYMANTADDWWLQMAIQHTNTTYLANIAGAGNAQADS